MPGIVLPFRSGVGDDMAHGDPIETALRQCVNLGKRRARIEMALVLAVLIGHYLVIRLVFIH